MRVPFLLPLRVNGSENSTAIWIEDASGARIATIKNGPLDADRAKAICEAVNEHRFDSYKEGVTPPDWRGNPAID